MAKPTKQIEWPALKALLSYEQADEDGVMVLVSRQAIHEVADRASAMQEALEDIAAIRAKGPYISAKDGFQAAMNALDAVREIARAAKSPTPQQAES